MAAIEVGYRLGLSAHRRSRQEKESPVSAIEGSVLALLAFILVTLLGTVPINKGMLDWRTDAPPADWKEIIRRWERLDTVRCGAAVLAFAFFVVAVAR